MMLVSMPYFITFPFGRIAAFCSDGPMLQVLFLNGGQSLPALFLAFGELFLSLFFAFGQFLEHRPDCRRVLRKLLDGEILRFIIGEPEIPLG